jgi:hypothetical protein
MFMAGPRFFDLDNQYKLISRLSNPEKKENLLRTIHSYGWEGYDGLVDLSYKGYELRFILRSKNCYNLLLKKIKKKSPN